MDFGRIDEVDLPRGNVVALAEKVDLATVGLGGAEEHRLRETPAELELSAGVDLSYRVLQAKALGRNDGDIESQVLEQLVFGELVEQADAFTVTEDASDEIVVSGPHGVGERNLPAQDLLITTSEKSEVRVELRH